MKEVVLATITALLVGGTISYFMVHADLQKAYDQKVHVLMTRCITAGDCELSKD